MKLCYIILSALFGVLSINANAQKGSESLVKANAHYFKKEWSKAIPYFEEALRDTSNSALLWQRSALSNFMTGNLDKALKQYERALKLSPNPFLRNIIQSQIVTIYDTQKKPDATLAFLHRESNNGFSNTMMLDTIHIVDSFRKTNDFTLLYNKLISNSYPCLTEPHRNDFDFWVGEWDVYQTGTDNLVGHSMISKSVGNCSVIEEWKSLGPPNTGQSINYYDPVKGAWEQVYVGSGGNVTRYVDGKFENGQMHFNYQSAFNGSSYTGNFIFFNQGPDQVRQYQDYTTDGGKTFTVGTDLTYKRKKG